MKILRERLVTVLALLGGVVYFLRALQNVHIRTSFLDEGLYQYKGWLYATGRAVPFADYAPWTNHMPLSYLIPGYVQRWFGPSLDAGRYLSVACALLFLLGVWLIVRRWGGMWLAAGAVWAFALNLASIKLYSMGLLQAAVACMLVWALFLMLDEHRATWQIAAAGVLTALMAMTRLNMGLVAPILLLYVWWQHGRRAAGWFVVSGVLVGGALHLLFWPGILKLWAAWLPRALTPFLDPWRMFVEARPAHSLVPSPALKEYWLYLWESVRLHYLMLGSALATWLLWPQAWHSTAQRKAAWLLSVLLIALYGAHLWVAFAGGFCVSCILLYEAYFDFLGLILLAVVWRALPTRLPWLQQALVGGVVLLSGIGITYAAASDVIRSAWFYQVRPLLEPLSVWLWHLLVGWGGISARAVYYLNAALLIGGLFLVAGLYAWRYARSRFAHSLLVAAAILGLVLTPTRVLGGGNDFFACGDANVPASYQQVGAYLQARLLPGAQVAWVGRIPALFLYLPDVQVYPPQLNHYHSFWVGGDTNTLYRFSRWNEDLGIQWMQAADYVLIEEAWLQDDWVQRGLQVARLDEVDTTPPVEPCRPEASRIHVFVPSP